MASQISSRSFFIRFIAAHAVGVVEMIKRAASSGIVFIVEKCAVACILVVEEKYP